MSFFASGASAPQVSFDDSKHEKKISQQLSLWRSRLLSVALAFAAVVLCFVGYTLNATRASRGGSGAASAPRVAARPVLPGPAELPPLPPPPPPPLLLPEAALAPVAPPGPPHEEEPIPPPSWLPAAPTSCVGFFGNGYSKPLELVRGVASEPALLSCMPHDAIVAAFCVARNAILDPARVEMSAGGERVEDVMGRSEASEVPEFAVGALEIVVGNLDTIASGGSIVRATGVPEGDALDALGDAGDAQSFTMLHNMLDHIDPYKMEMLAKTRILRTGAALDARRCASRVRDRVIAVTRMEYANLFHTTTDWYNVWSVARVLGVEPVSGDELAAFASRAADLSPKTVISPFLDAPKLPVHVLFLDGHNAGPMDEGWLGLFVSISYLKHFSGPVCFDDIVFAPFGCVRARVLWSCTLRARAAGKLKALTPPPHTHTHPRCADTGLP